MQLQALLSVFLMLFNLFFSREFDNASTSRKWRNGSSSCLMRESMFWNELKLYKLIVTDTHLLWNMTQLPKISIRSHYQHFRKTKERYPQWKLCHTSLTKRQQQSTLWLPIPTAGGCLKHSCTSLNKGRAVYLPFMPKQILCDCVQRATTSITTAFKWCQPKLQVRYKPCTEGWESPKAILSRKH